MEMAYVTAMLMMDHFARRTALKARVKKTEMEDDGFITGFYCFSHITVQQSGTLF
jgi:hypothetical protein